MCDRKHWTNILACHAGYVTDLVDRNCIKLAYEPRWLWTHRYTCTTVDAGIPIEVENDGWVLHEKLLVDNLQIDNV